MKKTYRVVIEYCLHKYISVEADSVLGADAEAGKYVAHLNETPGEGYWAISDIYEVPGAE